MEQEPALAEYVGWNKTTSLEENLHSLSSHINSLPLEHAKFAFVLGYPETAIRSFARHQELIQNGFPTFRDLAEATRDWRAEEPLKTDYWRPLNRAAFKEIGQVYQHMHNRLDRVKLEERFVLSQQLFEQFRKKFAEDLLRIYQEEFDLSKEDASVLIFEYFITMRNHLGQAVYGFKTFGHNTDQAPDVIALQEKVSRAFEREQHEDLAAK